MNPTNQNAAARSAVTREAKAWLGTPYHKGQCLKGVAADCAMLLVGVYAACGVMAVKPADFGLYPPDGHDARNTQRYLLALQRRARELPPTEIPQPGDIVLVKLGRVFNHAAIVIAWPQVIHAWRVDVTQVNALNDPAFLGFEKKFFNPFLAKEDTEKKDV